MPFPRTTAGRRAITRGLRRLAWPLLILGIRRRFPDVAVISCEDLAEQLAGKGPTPLLIDARGLEEFGLSHLPGARWLPGPDASGAAGLARQTAIVVYCSVGYRSARLARSLRRAGFTDVRNLEGSLFRWANLGLPLAGAVDARPRVHPFHPCWSLLLEPDPPLGPGPALGPPEAGDPHPNGQGEDS
ncbi:rhodanese-like domain-containing protein [Synechococcus sp. CCAP 1479/9]|uniref:rhodanese-like domain-containing protein n=1 Tax=Synechococcus sp. CCAP 1479/9 TaxID=1221593 RepID=UPI001C21724A|nr:rhodanese-like domain-containing protein [Synechococcus sp. CCAP 1479/9]